MEGDHTLMINTARTHARTHARTKQTTSRLGFSVHSGWLPHSLQLMVPSVSLDSDSATTESRQTLSVSVLGKPGLLTPLLDPLWAE